MNEFVPTTEDIIHSIKEEENKEESNIDNHNTTTPIGDNTYLVTLKKDSFFISLLKIIFSLFKKK